MVKCSKYSDVFLLVNYACITFFFAFTRTTNIVILIFISVLIDLCENLLEMQTTVIHIAATD